MKNILLPTDFSLNSLNAINYAQELFTDVACTFHILNTYTPIIYSYDYQMNTGGLGEVVDVIRNSSLEQLKELEKSIKEKYKNSIHQFDLISSFNTLTDEMDLLVSKHNIDLIIMGTKGASGLQEVLFGTNTIHTIKKAKCPVLAIPNGYFFEQPKDILFPSDFKIDFNQEHLNILNSIGNLFDSKVHILHVSSNRSLNATEQQRKKKLEKLSNTKKAFYNVKDQEISKAIHEFQQSTYVHLLMMIKNKHTFLENIFFKKVIHQIGFHLTVPFLVVPS